MLHSPTMPRWRMVLIATERSSWYSSSLSVWLGATTMDSPVWMPIGSRFSMLQTAMQLSRPSRTTSYSISFQPRRLSSTSTWDTPPAKARRSAWSRSASLSTMPLPWPPRAKPPRSITGKPISRAAARASSAVRQARLRAVATPISANRSMKSLRSSVSRMVFTGVPSTRTPYLSRTPASSSASPQLSAVWPPKESRRASTSSLTRIRSTNSGVTAVR